MNGRPDRWAQYFHTVFSAEKPASHNSAELTACKQTLDWHELPQCFKLMNLRLEDLGGDFYLAAGMAIRQLSIKYATDDVEVLHASRAWLNHCWGRDTLLRPYATTQESPSQRLQYSACLSTSYDKMYLLASYFCALKVASKLAIDWCWKSEDKE